MIAMVIIRFVAILQESANTSHNLAKKKTSQGFFKERGEKTRGSVPTSHAPQRLNTRIDIAFTLLQIIARILHRTALNLQI